MYYVAHCLVVKKSDMTAVIFLVFSMMMTSVVTSHITLLYVKSDMGNSTCPSDYDVCETLEYYSYNTSSYFSSNDTVFCFLSGNHILNSTITISNVSNFTLFGITDSRNGTSVTIECIEENAGLVFYNAHNINLANLVFISCNSPIPDSIQWDIQTAHAALAFKGVTNLLLDSVSVQNSTSGYGLFAHCVQKTLNISRCKFTSNTGNEEHLGGNAAIYYANCSIGEPTSVVVDSSSFCYGGYMAEYSSTVTLATGLILILSQSNISVKITNVTMNGNKNNYLADKGLGGNMFIHFYNTTNFISNTVVIQNSSFVYGSSWLGAGIGATFYTSSELDDMSEECNNSLQIINCTISSNAGIVGIGVYIEVQLKNESSYNYCPHNFIRVSDSIFENNTLFIPEINHHLMGNGVSMHILHKYEKNLLPRSSNHFKAIISDSVFKRNKLVTNITSEYTKLDYVVMTVFIRNLERSLTIDNCNFTDNKFTGIGISNSIVFCKSDIILRNNNGINGGGMMLCESSYIILKENTKLRFIDNSAIVSGGGIYVEESCVRTKPFCFYQIDYKFTTLNCSNVETIEIVMENNTAGYAGDHIYGGSLDHCTISDCNSTEVFHSIFTLCPNQIESGYSAISSDQKRLCFCNNNIPSCDQEFHVSNTTPGGNITVEAAVVGQFEGIVPGTIMLIEKMITLKPKPYAIGKTCTSLKITVHAKNNKFMEYAEMELYLSSDLTNMSQNITYLSVDKPRYINVTLKPCPFGFSQKDDICVCDNQLKKRYVTCYIETNIIQRQPPVWIGSIRDKDTEVIMYHPFCPYGYCVDEEVNITSSKDTLSDQDRQCASHHTGLLCAKCKENYTLSLSTTKCIKCSNKLSIPISILGYLLAGIAIVFIFVVFDITWTDGTFSGLLFYANIVDLHNYIFFPNTVNPLTVMVSWMNLNLGISACIYEGMDSYAKSWLSFCFPLYLFLIAGILIYLCRVSHRLAELLGRNIIRVLATLFQLSYTKLIQSVVIALSFVEIQYYSSHSNTTVKKLVWLSDPNLDYFGRKHFFLGMTGIILGILILVYTLVLLFVKPLQRYSHKRLFSWMAKLKPLVDAYTAPHIIKDDCRYWEGLLLFFRLVISLTASVKTEYSRVNNIVGSILISCALILTIAWSVGGVYKKTYLNILNSSCIFNLTFLAIFAARIRSKPGKRPIDNLTFKCAVYTSLAVAVVTLLAVLAYHIYLNVRRCYYKCRRYQYEPLDISDMNQLIEDRAVQAK